MYTDLRCIHGRGGEGGKHHAAPVAPVWATVRAVAVGLGHLGLHAVAGSLG